MAATAAAASKGEVKRVCCRGVEVEGRRSRSVGSLTVDGDDKRSGRARGLCRATDDRRSMMSFV